MFTRLYNWYGKRTVRLVILVLILIVAIGIVLKSRGSTPDEAATAQLRTVETASVLSIANDQITRLIGTVEAVNEARVETETSGRITSVSVDLGDAVSTGEIIAQIENASQRAAVLQAEGVYDAAVAAASVSDVSVNTARNSAINTYRNAYTTVNDVMLNTVDELFADPFASTPGLKIEGKGNTAFLNSERVIYRTLLSNWQTKATTLSVGDDLQSALSEARENVTRTLTIVEIFLKILPDQSVNGAYTQTEISAFQNDFVTAQQTLNSALSSIDNAKDALTSAQFGGTGSAVSAANAQVKQALGALRSAQATLEKTIIRSPLSGTVNSVDVKVGDFVGSFAPVATIANNNALEITTFIGEGDRSRISVDDEVTIEGQYKGRIARIAPAINSNTGKIEVKIQTEAETLQNGDTVSLIISPSETNTAVTDVIRIPLTAVKLASDRAFVFTVDNDVLVEHEVELGKANGSVVVIESGIDPNWEIVLDARGFNAGVRVNVAGN